MQTARDLMRRRVISVSPQTLAEEALDLLLKYGVSGLPVVNSVGRVVGVFSEVDRIQQGSLEGQTVDRLMSKKVVTVDVQDSLAEVARVFKESSVRRLPVIEDGAMVGIIGLRDLIRYIRDTERTLRGITPFIEAWELAESEC